MVTTADKTDRQGALDAINLHRDTLQNVEVVLVDGGYTGEPFSLAVNNLIGSPVDVAKTSELHKFAVIPQRWVVERSFAWLEKCRRLWKNCEKHLNTSLQFINLAFLRLLLHRKYSGYVLTKCVDLLYHAKKIGFSCMNFSCVKNIF